MHKPLMNAIMCRTIIKRKMSKMSKIASSSKNPISVIQIAGVVCITLVLTFSVLANPFVSADVYQDKINELNAQNEQKKQSQGVLSVEATSLADAINKLQAQIDASQARINQLNGDIVTLRAQIVEAQTELEKQKDLLGTSIKAMYVNGEISTVEMLASSKDLSDFFDKQQYQDNVRSKIKTTLDKVTQLKLELNTKKEAVEKSLAEQQSLQAQLSNQRAEKDRVLALNQNEQSKLETEIKNNSAAITELKHQQVLENAKHFKGFTVVAGNNGNDTYPNAWRNAVQDTLIDNWGMYNRECVSYTAWKVASTGRNMPYWGGIGNANQWDTNARNAGISVDGTPRPGDVAIAHWGYYGHAMYVESVNANGTINISQYNWDYNGTYSEAYNFPASGLAFIHFQ